MTPKKLERPVALEQLLAAALPKAAGKLLAGRPEWLAAARNWATRDPLTALAQFLAAAALALYAAEQGANPRIRTYVDAFYYISTCASVGYADIFAVTQAGRAIAALVMMVGPALAARALKAPQAPVPQGDSA
ncbi:MAG: two pore domain potassium channel family protein [Anaerolineales bacterium]|nr:two pore domain potassium channel family protein [Anaerolineales bacterium]